MFLDLFIISFILFIVTYFLLKLFIPNAHKFGLLDIPNQRSSHKIIIPRGAGIIFVFVFLISILIFYFFYSQNTDYHYIFISLLIVYLTGVYDDIKNINSKNKFIFIIIAALIAYFEGFSILSLGNYFGYELSLGYFALPFTILAIVGFTNALNLTDGLDGLAGSISIIIFLSLFFIGVTFEDKLLIWIPILFTIILSAFLIFNWHPAKVFMGDSGSLFLGFSIAMLSIYALKYVNPMSMLFLAAIPLLDTFVVMRRRKQRSKSMFEADKSHLHHVLLKLKKDHLFTVKSLLKIQMAFGLVFIQVYDKSDFINLILFFSLFIIFFKLFDPRASYRQKIKK